MANQKRVQQKSKLARANIKLSRMIAKYYLVDFDILAIRKEVCK